MKGTSPQPDGCRRPPERRGSRRGREATQVGVAILRGERTHQHHQPKRQKRRSTLPATRLQVRPRLIHPPPSTTTHDLPLDEARPVLWHGANESSLLLGGHHHQRIKAVSRAVGMSQHRVASRFSSATNHCLNVEDDDQGMRLGHEGAMLRTRAG